METAALYRYLQNHPKTRKRLIWCLALCVLVITALVLLPVAAGYYGEQWLREHGAKGAQIEDVDLNLFTGRVVVEGLQAGTGVDERLQVGQAIVNLRWWPLFSKRLYIQALHLEAAQIDVINHGDGRWQIGGVLIEPAAPLSDAEAVKLESDSGFAWGVGSEALGLERVQLHYHDAFFDTDVNIREVFVGSNFSWQKGSTAEFRMDLDVNGAPFELHSDIAPWADKREFKGQLKLTDLQLVPFTQALQHYAGINDPSGRINFDLALSIFHETDGRFGLNISGPLEIRQAGFSHEQLALANRQLHWDGEVQLQFPATQEAPLLQMTGALRSDGSSIRLSAAQLTTALDGIDWQGKFAFSPAREAEAAPTLMLQGELVGRGGDLSHAQLSHSLARLEFFRLGAIDLQRFKRVTASEARLEGLHLLTGGQAQAGETLKLETLTVHDIAFDMPSQLTADTMLFEGLQLVLARNEQGELARIHETLQTFSKAQEVETKDERATPLQVAVNEIEIRSDQALRFNDRSVQPPVNFGLDQLALTIRQLDSRTQQPMAVQLSTGQGAFQLDAQGEVAAFAEQPVADITLQLRALSLPLFSSYVADYHIERGRLNTDSKVLIKGDRVDARNEVVIDKLKLAGKNASSSRLVAEGMDMPLDVALDLLRDKNDRIELALPVTGSLSDPQFGTGDILRKATQKAVQSAAMFYVQNALQPWGALLLAKDLASKAARPSFESVMMAPGRTVLSDEARQYLKQLATLLAERPGLAFSICGVATPADRQALAQPAGVEGEQAADSEPVVISDADLQVLAEQRTATVMEFLADQEGVRQTRLFACRATIEQRAEAKPRVKIGL